MYRFRPRNRLTHAREFQAVYAARLRKQKGPLVLFARPNDLPYPRLGLAVGRAVGPAVVRNRVKRLIRESFRLLQHNLPRRTGEQPLCYDYIVSVRPHEPLSLDDCRRLLLDLAQATHRGWERRARQEDPP